MSTRTGRYFISLFLVVLLVSVPFGSSPKVGAADWTPTPPPSIYDPNAGPWANRRNDFITDVCETTEQLECVESIAAELNNIWVEGSPKGITQDSTARLWTIPGVTNLNGTTDLNVMHRINYTGNVFLQTNISAANTPGLGGRASQGDLDDKSLPLGVKFRATVRTSWVLPTHVSGKSTDTVIQVEKLPISGASRITLSGIPTTYMVIHDESTLTSPTGKGAYEVRELSLTVADGRFLPIKKECIEKPTIMTSENGYGQQVPTFKNGSLDLKLESPHFRSDGVTKHIGIYEAVIPMETATCLWGEVIQSTSSFVVDVIDPDGTEKTATTSVDVTSDAIIIKASGFSFSTPIIRVKYTSATTSRPKKPTGVRTTTSKGTITVKFNRVRGLSYSATSEKGKSLRTLRCNIGSSTVACKGTKLTKGRWIVTVTPRQGTTKGTAYSKTVVIR